MSYFVNLPNAFITYILKSEQISVFDKYAVFFAIIVIGLIIAALVKSWNIIKSGNAVKKECVQI